MRKLRVYLWHGSSPQLSNKIKNLWPEAIRSETDGTYHLPLMSLEDFYIKWQDKFMVLPQPDTGSILIGITQHGNFSQR